MRTLFGVPIGSFAVGIALVLGAALGVVVALGVRNRVLVRLGVRNVGRRRARTVLIIVGLMLGTAIISSALSTGDTISYAIRSDVVEALGATDEVVARKGAPGLDAGGWAGGVSATGDVASYFRQNAVTVVRDRFGARPPVDGVAAAIVEMAAVQDVESRQTEPRVTLFGADSASMTGFEPITVDGREVRLADLAAGEVYLDQEGADELRARRGDELTVYVAGALSTRRVRDVVEFRGTGTTGPALLLPLVDAQQLVGHRGEVNRLLISNTGGPLSGVGHTDEVVEALQPAVADAGLDVVPVKQDGLDQADEVGSVFMSVFTTFGTFSIAAGVVLIFLIFVMLAAERRTEMGIARAVGTQRSHLVQMFVYEGAVYDLLAAAVGALLGVVVAFGMVAAMARAFGTTGFDIRYHVEPRSLWIGFGLGTLVTLAVIAVSAWRVSILHIATAIRNQPAPLSRPAGRVRWLRAIGSLLLGLALLAGGVAGAAGLPTLLGTSIVLISVVPIARALGVPQRLAYTVAGAALVVFWLLPFGVLRGIFGDLRMDFSVWIVGGLLVVVGASWTIIYNADALLAALQATFGRARSLAPVLKTSAAYPLRNRFRTGVTLAMFTLVVFTLVVGSATTTAFNQAFDDPDSFGGGFDVIAGVAPTSPLEGAQRAVAEAPGIDRDQVEVVAASSTVGVEVRQSGTGQQYADYPLRGFDDTFLTTTTYGFAARADGYRSDDQIWTALARDPSLAVIDAYAAPRRDAFGFGEVSDLHLTGFFLEDRHFAPVPLEIQDPQTGQVRQLTVIGILKDTASAAMLGVSTSQRALAPYGDRARPTSYLLGLAPGVDPRDFAARLESAFLANGMQADAVAELLDDQVGASLTLNRLILGFMGLGLVVGVAALGVISARSVVERRQQIGVLRAIGFQQSMVRRTFLLEAAFLSLTAITVGTAIGLVMAYNIIADQARLPSWDTLSFVVPWQTLGIVFAAVLVAALLATYIPARRASRIYPAAALRYE
jgi:putative ABC transport system permease protein